jgi:hypothetical protein
VKCCRGVLHSNNNFKASRAAKAWFSPRVGQIIRRIARMAESTRQKAAAENAAALIGSTVVEAELLVLVAAVTRGGS